MRSSRARLGATERTHLLQAEERLFRSLRSDQESKDSSSQSRTLGTFDGVFAPVSLSMLSSVLFLRIGYIVGNAGLMHTLLQLMIAYSILVSTVLSICALASNGAVETGGVYFMISRTLGIEFGGSIGILFWFANCVSCALYLTACVEGLTANFAAPNAMIAPILPDATNLGNLATFGYASLFNALNLLIGIVGSKLFGRTSSLVLSTVVFCALATAASFMSNEVVEEHFVFNKTDCDINANINDTLANCTTEENGSFFGLLATQESREMSVTELLWNNMWPKYEYDCSGEQLSSDLSFFTVFGVLFSGVTGIMSGANVSGELIEPSQSIPQGTLLACFFTFSLLTLLSTLTAITCQPVLLQHNCLYMSSFSFWPPLVAIGVLLATFSASLNNLIGASRVLQAVSKDVARVLRESTENLAKNEVLPVIISWFCVQLFLLMGSLNTIAQLSSVLFLLSYASVNLACLGLDLASAPNFRPAFNKFCWQTCLIGLTGTMIMMLAVSPLFAAVSLLLCLSLIFAFLNFVAPFGRYNWGSISQALLFHQVRKYLLLLDPRKEHVKFWRPQVLLLISNPRSSCSLIDFVNALKKGGLYVLGHVVVSEEEYVDTLSKQQSHWLSLVDHLGIKAFVELTIAPNLRSGVEQLIRLSGLGALKPNTIVLGFRDETFHADDFLSPFSPFATNNFEGRFPHINQKGETIKDELINNNKRVGVTEYVSLLQLALGLQKNVCVARHFQQLNKGELFRAERDSIFGTRARKKLYLDVWLADFFVNEQIDICDTTSLFLLQLATIVNRVPRWKKLVLRVVVLIKTNYEEVIGPIETPNETSTTEGLNLARRDRLLVLDRMLELLRIKAQTSLVFWSTGENATSKNHLESASNFVRQKSAETAVVFQRLPDPNLFGDAERYMDCLTTLTSHGAPTMLVRGVSPVTSITL